MVLTLKTFYETNWKATKYSCAIWERVQFIPLLNDAHKVLLMQEIRYAREDDFVIMFIHGQQQQQGKKREMGWEEEKEEKKTNYV